LTVVSPDAGGVERARFFAKKVDAALAIVDKRRVEMNVAEVMHVIGDVNGRTCLIIDDLIDTAGTLVKTCGGIDGCGRGQGLCVRVARRAFGAGGGKFRNSVIPKWW
jgi:ribose-phosphate pyrophosphokinase